MEVGIGWFHLHRRVGFVGAEVGEAESEFPRIHTERRGVITVEKSCS